MPISGKKLVQLMRKEGWQLARINGSHHILEKDGKTVSVPVHGNRALGKGLERKLLKESEVSKQ